MCFQRRCAQPTSFLHYLGLPCDDVESRVYDFRPTILGSGDFPFFFSLGIFQRGNVCTRSMSRPSNFEAGVQRDQGTSLKGFSRPWHFCVTPGNPPIENLVLQYLRRCFGRLDIDDVHSELQEPHPASENANCLNALQLLYNILLLPEFHDLFCL